jgi:hypothetical protein
MRVSETSPPLGLAPTKEQSKKKGRGLRTLPPWLVPGNPGHRSAARSGNDKIAQLCRKHTKEDSIPMLVAIVKDGDGKAQDRIRASEVLGRWAGLDAGPQMSVNDNRTFARVEQVLYLPPLGQEIHPEAVNGRCTCPNSVLSSRSQVAEIG